MSIEKIGKDDIRVQLTNGHIEKKDGEYYIIKTKVDGERVIVRDLTKDEIKILTEYIEQITDEKGKRFEDRLIKFGLGDPSFFYSEAMYTAILLDPVINDLITDKYFEPGFRKKYNDIRSGLKTFREILEDAYKSYSSTIKNNQLNELEYIYGNWIRTAIKNSKTNTEETNLNLKVINAVLKENIPSYERIIERVFISPAVVRMLVMLKQIKAIQIKKIFAKYSYSEDEKLDIGKTYLMLCTLINDKSIKDLVMLSQEGLFSSEDLLMLISSKEEEEAFYKNSGFRSILQTRDVLKAIAKGYDFSYRELKEHNITQEYIISVLKNGEISKELFLPLIKNLSDKVRPNSDGLYSLYRVDSIPKNIHIIGNQSLSENRCFTGKEILELIKVGYIEQKRLVDVYEQQRQFNEVMYYFDEQGNINNNSNFDDITIWPEEFLMYFDANRVLEMLQNEEYVERFKKMYKEIRLIASNREDTSFIERYEQNFINSFVQGRKEENKGYSENLITLVKEGIVTPETVLQYLESEDIMRLHEENCLEISDYVLSKLTPSDIENLYLSDEITIQKIVDSLNSGVITIETFKEILTNGALKGYIDNGEITNPHSLLDSYMQGHITAQDIGEIATDKNGIIDINRLNIDEYKFPVNEEESEEQQEETRKGYVQKIEELLLLGIIKFRKLEDLENYGVLTQEEFQYICTNKAYQEAIEAIKSLPDEIENDSTPEGESRSILQKSGNGSGKKRKYAISPAEIHDLLSNLSTDSNGECVLIEKMITEGAFKGYTVLLLEKLGIVVLEKMYAGKIGHYADTTIGNATYILPVAQVREETREQASDIILHSNKSEVRTKSKKSDGKNKGSIYKNVRFTSHTKNYAQRLIEIIIEIQNATIPKNKEGIIWLESSLGKEKESKLIEKIVQNYNENMEH